MDEDKDLEAVRRCLGGEPDAFEPIILRYQKPLMNLAYRIVRNREDARDIAQSAFVKAYQALPSYAPGHKFFSWLYRIAVNEALNFAARRSRKPVPQADWTSAPAGPEEAWDARELRGSLERALGRLLPLQRALLALGADGLSYREIGEALDLSESKVKSRLFAARRKLRDVLAADGGLAHA